MTTNRSSGKGCLPILIPEYAIVLNLLEDQGIEPEEIARLREMLVQKDTIGKDAK